MSFSESPNFNESIVEQLLRVDFQLFCGQKELNPIPTGHGLNQPIYSYHVTQACRKRVKKGCSVRTKELIKTKERKGLIDQL